MGLPRELRLKKPEDFARLRVNGKTFRNRVLLVNVMPNGLTHNRYGLITPKKLGSAVIRNRIRRLLRERLRHLHPHLKPGHDLAILALAGAVGTPLASPLADLLRQAELFV